MVAKKRVARGKPKTDKVYYQPSQGALKRQQAALHKYDDEVNRLERKWGIDRLPWLVPVELRDRFYEQLDKLNSAIDATEGVEHEVEVTLRGCAAIERAAIEGGAEPLTGEYIEGRMPDGTVLAITANGYEAGKVKQDNREMTVYTVDEVGVILEQWLKEKQAKAFVDEAKNVFAGAVVESVTKTAKLIDDEIPF
jgi:hypothetical protein